MTNQHCFNLLKQFAIAALKPSNFCCLYFRQLAPFVMRMTKRPQASRFCLRQQRSFIPLSFYSGLQPREVQPFGFVCIAAPLRMPLYKRRCTSLICNALYYIDFYLQVESRSPPMENRAGTTRYWATHCSSISP
jgi:hypothetical protein